MQTGKIPYLLYIFFMLIFVASIFSVPMLEMRGSNLAEYAYPMFHYTCHQINSRSLCLFPAGEGYSLEDCTLDSSERDFRMTQMVVKEGITGYKLPVCARDIAIYLGMLIAGLALPLLQKPESKEIPNKWLFLLALVPMALDGGTQLIGLRESTNLIRMITGGIAGIAVPFYLIPVLNELWESIFKGKKEAKADEKQAGKTEVKANENKPEEEEKQAGEKEEKTEEKQAGKEAKTQD